MAVACLSHSTSHQGRISCTPRFHYPQRTYALLSSSNSPPTPPPPPKLTPPPPHPQIRNPHTHHHPPLHPPSKRVPLQLPGLHRRRVLPPRRRVRRVPRHGDGGRAHSAYVYEPAHACRRRV